MDYVLIIDNVDHAVVKIFKVVSGHSVVKYSKTHFIRTDWGK